MNPADSPHLFEADKARIQNEAKVRTALEDPNFAEREFQRWREGKRRDLERESFATAWAKVAWLAEGRVLAMGRELAKVQARIGRQRKANRELVRALEGREREVERLTAANDALRVLKDPNQPPPIPFEKVKADLRIKELEAEVARLRVELKRMLDAAARNAILDESRGREMTNFGGQTLADGGDDAEE